MTRRRWVRAVLPGLLLAGLAFLLVRLQASAHDLEQASWPGAAAVGAALGLGFAGQVLFGLGWDRLLPDVGDHRALAWSFHGTQPVKYVPLGIAQPVGQVGVLRDLDLGVDVGGGALAWVGQVLTMVSAGVLLGAGLVFVTDDEWWRGLAALGVVAAPVLVARPVQVAVLGWLGRRARRVPPAEAVPPQAALLEAWALAAVALALHGTAFALLAAGEGDPIRLVLAYSVSTALSVATPLPAGLGVREALVVATSGLAAPAALGAALLLRVVLLVVELTLFGTTWLWHRNRPTGTTTSRA